MPPSNRAQASLETLIVLAALAAFLAVVLPASLHYQAAFEDLTAVQQAQSLAGKLDATSVAIAGLGPGSQAQVDAFVHANVTLQKDLATGATVLLVHTRTKGTKTLTLGSAPAPDAPIDWNGTPNHVVVNVRNDGTNVVLEAPTN